MVSVASVYHIEKMSAVITIRRSLCNEFFDENACARPLLTMLAGLDLTPHAHSALTVATFGLTVVAVGFRFSEVSGLAGMESVKACPYSVNRKQECLTVISSSLLGQELL